MTGAAWGLAAATFAASFVEFVEALTIVIAMGMTRSWKSALVGVGTAILALVAFTAAAGYALATWLPESLLQLVVGTLLLIFGLQWLRKAILRSSGLKALHDEDEEFKEQTAAAKSAGEVNKAGLDWFAFVVSFKGVFLEGVEVVFIVITFGLSAKDMPVAILGAGAAGLIVLTVGVAVRRPLAMIPENTLKYGVGLLLASFGTYWAVEGIGIFGAGGESLSWPGHDWAILALLATWFLLSVALVSTFRRRTRTREIAPTAEVNA
ncbi:COG4280 domain-containing protein [Actinopolymorpha alba]|uniref:COG4280 domain-containing protein n=1 Tax=Actinopolymorpha alba TaxID=533267 RepID=UPI00036C924A|nr:hypothetical protein [Actinopolymorpha alba]